MYTVMVGHEYKITIFTHVFLFVNGCFILWTCIYNTAFLCFFILVFFFYFYRKNKHCCCFFFVRWTTWEYIKISLIWWQKSCEKCVCRMFGILFFFIFFYFMEWLFADSCTENTFQNQFHSFFFVTHSLL